MQHHPRWLPHRAGLLLSSSPPSAFDVRIVVRWGSGRRPPPLPSASTSGLVLMLRFPCSAAGRPSPFSARCRARKQDGRRRFNTPNAVRVMERSLAKKKNVHAHTHGRIGTPFFKAACPLIIPDTVCVNKSMIPLHPLFRFSLRGFGGFYCFSPFPDFTRYLIGKASVSSKLQTAAILFFLFKQSCGPVLGAALACLLTCVKSSWFVLFFVSGQWLVGWKI